MIRPRGPLGFVASLLALWVAGRSGALYWLGGGDVLARPEPAAVGSRPVPSASVAGGGPSLHAPAAVMLIEPAQRRGLRGNPFFAITMTSEPPGPMRPSAPNAPQHVPRAEAVSRETFLVPFPPKPAGAPLPGRRLRSSAWAFLREGAGDSLAGGGQLGGSQAGVRFSYALGADARSGLALFGRVSAPLRQSLGKEAAVGLEWTPLQGLPLRLSAERRFGLDRGGRDAFAAGMIAGVHGVSLPAGFRLEAYGQAGLVGARRRDAYVEAAVRVDRRLLTVGPAEISAGAGAWGGAQPGVERLDLGPQLVARFKAGELPLRLNLDWRQRVAGNARPGSGPALTLAADF